MRIDFPSNARIFTLACAVALGSAAPAHSAEDPDELYRHREDVASAGRAADVWTQRGAGDFEAAWKLARVCYWLGKHLPEDQRRRALERGVSAGEAAIRLEPDRPEGHFWMAASMGTLAESFGLTLGLRYRGRIKQALERVLAIDEGWQGGSAHGALGRWYHEVPRLFGGSESKAEEHLRRALTFDAQNLAAATFLVDVLTSTGRHAEARTLLQQIADAPVSTEWAPEDREFKKQAADRLKALDARR